jgi:hypothetical protein
MVIVFFSALLGIIVNLLFLTITKLIVFKVFLIISIVAILFPLTFISFLLFMNRQQLKDIGFASLTVPKTLIVNGVKYRNGFYGELWTFNLTFIGDTHKAGAHEFRRIEHRRFDLLHSKIGDKSGGILYCAEEQWETAKSFYADGNNFVYYCRIGRENTEHDSLIVTINDIDPLKFNALTDFANKNSYKAFGSNRGAETRRIAIPDGNVAPELVFYKESRDGIFTSFKGHKFYVLDGKLLLVFYYDYGHGKYENLVVVDVTEELGQYFVELFLKLTS